MQLSVPSYDGMPPQHLRTAAQLRATGLWPGPGVEAVGWLRKVFEGDVWQTELYADPRAAPARPALLMTVVHWRRSKVHITLDGERTACGAYLPAHATIVAVTPDWHLHTGCYNCASKLWPRHAPAGYQRPLHSGDFPIRRRGEPRRPYHLPEPPPGKPARAGQAAVASMGDCLF